jgi:hypothetical protein
MSTPFQAAAAKALGGAADDGTFAAGANAGSSEQQQQGAGQPIPASFCCVMRADGCLQLFALPSMQCVLSDAEALLGPQVCVCVYACCVRFAAWLHLLFLSGYPSTPVTGLGWAGRPVIPHRCWAPRVRPACTLAMCPTTSCAPHQSVR